MNGKSLVIFTQSHELTHFIKEQAPESFKKFADLLVEKYEGNGVSVDRFVKIKMEQSVLDRGVGNALSYDEAFEEVVCDSCEDFLADTNIQQTIIEFAKVDKNLAEKIKEFLKGLVEKLENAIKGLRGQSAEAEFLRDFDMDELEELKALWTSALFDARDNVLQAKSKEAKTEKNTTGEGDVRYSISKTRNISWNAQIRGLLEKSGQIKRNDTLVVEKNTPIYLQSDVIEDLPLAIPLSVVAKASNGKDVSHSIKKEKIIELQKGIKNAEYVIENPDRNSFAFVTNIKQNGHPILVSFFRNTEFDGDRVHKATSIHLQMNVASMLKALPETATIYVKNKNKFNKAVGATNNLRGLSANVEFIEDILSQNSEKSRENIQYSLRKIDNRYIDAINRGDIATAQMLVKECAEKAGYTDVLYHGTKEFGFTKFDATKSDDKISFFVAGSDDIAQTYSGKYGSKVISNVESVDNLSIEEVVNKLREDAKNDYQDMQNEYEIMHREDVNALINKVNSEIENLQSVVEQKIKDYAEKLSTDFDDETYKKHKYLIDLVSVLKDYQYDDMPTKIYMLLHHTDVFSEGVNPSEIEELTVNIRIMNRLVNTDIGEGVVVNKQLGGYGLKILGFDEARTELKTKLSSGNYALFGKPGKQFVVDCKGSNWNDITYYEDSPEGFEEFYPNGSWRKGTTRDVVKYAKSRGYDSVKFENIVDNGGWGENVGAGDVYAYFNPNDLKSADTVTYDSEGKVIPLSERFNEKSDDIRYQKRGHWKPNMSRTDFEQIERIAKSEVSSSDKYIDNITKWLYNTKNGKTYFAIYSTEDETSPTVLYASRGRQAVADSEFTEYYVNRLNEMEVDSYVGRPKTFNEVFSRYQGSDGLRNSNSGFPMERRTTNGDVQVYNRTSGSGLSRALCNCLQDSFKRRERESVERIEDSLKYQDRTTQLSFEDLDIDYKKENEILKEDIEKLKEKLALQRTVTHGKVLAKASYEGVAKNLLHEFGMKRVTNKELLDEFIGKLDGFYTNIINEQNLSWDDIYSESLDIAKWIDSKLPEQVVYKNPNAIEILRDIREKGIRLSETEPDLFRIIQRSRTALCSAPLNFYTF